MKDSSRLEKIKTAGSVLFILACLCAFWIFLFQGVIAEQDRKEKTKATRKWLHEKALNQYQTENQPELVKAMRMAQEAK